MYTSKLKIKTSSVNVWRSLCWWSGLSDCLVTSSISQGRLQKKPTDRNCCDDSKARREDLGWQSEGVVWRRHWIQTGKGRRGTGVLGCADSWTPWGRAWTWPALVHCANVVRYVRVTTNHGRRSNLGVPLTTRAAAFSRRCSLSVITAQWPWASYLHLCASVIKQYNLVPVKAGSKPPLKLRCYGSIEMCVLLCVLIRFHVWNCHVAVVDKLLPYQAV